MLVRDRERGTSQLVTDTLSHASTGVTHRRLREAQTSMVLPAARQLVQSAWKSIVIANTIAPVADTETLVGECVQLMIGEV